MVHSSMHIPRFRKTSRLIAAMRKSVEDAAKANELLRSRDLTACGDFLESPSNTARVLSRLRPRHTTVEREPAKATSLLSSHMSPSALESSDSRAVVVGGDTPLL